MWWKLISFFGSARALWVIIGMAVVVGGLYLKSGADAKTILELQVSSQSEAIKLLKGRVDRLNTISAEKSKREKVNEAEKQAWKTRFESMRNEIPDVNRWSSTPVPRELH